MGRAERRQRLRPARFILPAEQDMPTFIEQPPDDGEANARRSAGDDARLVIQPRHRLIPCPSD